MEFDGEVLWDCGLVSMMTLPGGWRLRASEDGGFAQWTAHHFGPADDPSLGISIYLPGIVATVADGLLYLTAVTPGLRRFDEEDLRDLAPVLSDMGDDNRFELHRIRGEYWNFLNVLFVEGVWRASGTRNAKLFVDQRGDGRLIQEIGAYAPASDRAGYELGLEALSGISWREQSCRI